MQKQKKYDVADSNIALLGSDIEKKVKEASAQSEKAWTGCGQKVGMEIWRIEKFKVVAVPKETYGTFYSGDSYILLNTYKKPGGDALAWDLHFWLGTYTSQDEAGTAAYKTVELDTLLGGAPIQHREVQGHESELFMGYFKSGLKLLEGGVDSGFKHVEPEKYKPRLLQLKGKKTVRVSEVELSFKSLNSGDTFILDGGLKIFQWNGSKSAPPEKSKGAQFSRAIADERKGKAKIWVLEEGDKSSDAADFWKILGGEGPVKSAQEGGDDAEAEKGQAVKKLFQLSDATGEMVFKEVASGKIARSKLDSKDAFIFDTGNEVFAWTGKGASPNEKKLALGYAQQYLTKYNRPNWIPISKILEGSENGVFESSFDMK
jgi:gelsolin